MTMTHSTILLAKTEQPPSDWWDRLSGPFGALALSVIGLYVCYRTIVWLVKRNKEVNDVLVNELRNQIKELKNQLDKK